MKNAIVLSLVVLFGLTLSYGQSDLPPNNYAYVVVTYSCRTGKNIAVFSQVFGACYQETNHSAIAINQRDTFTRMAAAACGGVVTVDGQSTSYPYQGPAAPDSANRDRENDLRDKITYGYRVENVYLQAPYSYRCRN